MYLAPLNYDRFFKKVFSHTNIAKRFLEDFLDVQIQKIEILEQNHFLTDDASRVEFDFRCTIDGMDIIIDMQQWYKTDVVKRFYTYHCAGTVLQLERVPDKKLPVADKKRTKTKDYRHIKPVITLIWMVDDTLGFNENFVAYSMTPELITHFIKNKELWEEPQIIENILDERKKMLKLINNETKDLSFIPQNRLVFMFQQTIVKDQNIAKYHRWFRFAEKTRNKENKQADFEEYFDDPFFHEIMRLLAKNKLKKEELDYISTESEKQEQISRFLKGEFAMGKKEAMRELKKVIEEKDKTIQDKDKTIEEERRKVDEAKQREEDAIKSLYEKEIPIEQICSIYKITKKEVERIVINK